MRRFQVWAAAAMLAGPSYAWAQPAEDLLGQPMPEIAAAAPRPAPAYLDGGGRTSLGLAKSLGKVQGDAPSAVRGSAESRIYQQASPAVVLIVVKDGVGSGALISADGRIITNAHVVEGADVVGVVFKPKTEGYQISKADMVMAKVIKRDEIADLALIQVETTPPGVTPLKIGSLASVQVGADVNAIGHPTGESWTYTRGIVSQIRRDYAWSYSDDGVQHRASVIQTQTPINPGNSGGPLLDDAMQIVGLNSFSEEGEGLNFAVSADELHAFLARPGDRLAKPTGPNRVVAAKKKCEIVELGSTRDKKRRGIYRDIDSDCDDKADFTVFEPDDEKEPYAYMFDDDKNGEIDMIIYDSDRDGEFDFALYDTDGDGDPDVRGDYRKGEDEPYRLERLPAKR